MEREPVDVSNVVIARRHPKGLDVIYRQLAHCVAILHILTILFFLLGGLASLLIPAIGWFHFPLAVWVCAAFIRGWKCPLTRLENRLLRAGGSPGYDSTFVDRLLRAISGRQNVRTDGGPPVSLGRQRERNLGLAFAIWNAALYAVHLPALYATVASRT
jgi:hypothetical protein